MTTARIRLVLLYGGRSAEHVVSCTTALHVLRAIEQTRYSVEAIGIGLDGSWNRLESSTLQRASSGEFESLPVGGTQIEVGTGIAASPGGTMELTVVFPLLHGPLGEDGTVQGLLELIDIAYVGSGVLGSALAMDKRMAKNVCGAAGIPQARHLVVTQDDVDRGDLISVVERELGLPCFVKPANMGSSVGVSRAATAEELSAAVQLALTYDRIALVEEAISGREIEVAVLGNSHPEVFGPGEVIPADDFYSYADKYLDGASQGVVPAQLDNDVAIASRQLAVQAFRALDCAGLARCDFFFEHPGRGLLLNEVNTMPGFTPISMYPKMVLAGGLPYPSLIDRLIDLAIDRHQSRPRRIDHP